MFKLALRLHETSTAVPGGSFAYSDPCCYRQSITDNFGVVASVLISNFQMRATFVEVNYIRCVTTIRGYTLSSSPLDIFSRASRKWTGVNSLFYSTNFSFFLKYGCGFDWALLVQSPQTSCNQSVHGSRQAKNTNRYWLKPSHNNQAAFQSNSSRSYRQTQILLPGGTPIYEPFWYVSPPRVGSLRRFGLKTGMFTEELQLCINELVESIPGE